MAFFFSLFVSLVLFAQTDNGDVGNAREMQEQSINDETSPWFRLRVATQVVSAAFSKECGALQKVFTSEDDFDVDKKKCGGTPYKYKLAAKAEVVGDRIASKSNAIDCSGHVAAILLASGCPFSPKDEPGKPPELETTAMVKAVQDGQSCFQFVEASGDEAGFVPGDIVVVGDGSGGGGGGADAGEASGSGTKEGHTFMISAVEDLGCADSSAELSKSKIRISHSSGKGPKVQDLNEYLKGDGGNARARAFNEALQRACRGGKTEANVGDRSGGVIRYNPDAHPKCKECTAAKMPEGFENCRNCDNYDALDKEFKKLTQR